MSDEIPTIKNNLRTLGSNVREDTNRITREIEEIRADLEAVMTMQCQINANLKDFYEALVSSPPEESDSNTADIE